MQSIRFLRKPDIKERSGLDAGGPIERLEKDGLFPPRLHLTQRTVGWPEHEVDAVLAARLAGKSDDEIRRLVKRLVADRAHALDGGAA